jgi:hypothetical protein
MDPGLGAGSTRLGEFRQASVQYVMTPEPDQNTYFAGIGCKRYATIDPETQGREGGGVQSLTRKSDSNLNLLLDHYRKLCKNSNVVCCQVPCVSSGLYHILVSQKVRLGHAAFLTWCEYH